MTTKELLALMRLLSAMESWAISRGERLPDYLQNDLAQNVALIERQILEKTT